MIDKYPRSDFFVRFLEELSEPKTPFEINKPLLRGKRGGLKHEKNNNYPALDNFPLKIDDRNALVHFRHVTRLPFSGKSLQASRHAGLQFSPTPNVVSGNMTL